MAKGVDRFRAATAHLDLAIESAPESTHTAQDAADAVGAPVGAIVKSLVFLADGDPLLVLVSGPNRVNVDALGERLGVTLARADADLVKSATGFSIGGVPPFGHPTPLHCVMDEDLLHQDVVWAAAGSAQEVFPLDPRRLVELSGATVLSVL